MHNIHNFINNLHIDRSYMQRNLHIQSDPRPETLKWIIYNIFQHLYTFRIRNIYSKVRKQI